MSRSNLKVLPGLLALICAHSLCVPFAHAAPLLSPADSILAIDLDAFRSNSRHPLTENPPTLLDNATGTKYLNFAGANSGFIVTPSASSVVQSFRLSTANDNEQRDPATYSLYGTNSPILSKDGSLGDSEPWTLISSGALALPSGVGSRQVAGPIVAFANATPYSSYRMVFPTVKNVPASTIMQISEAQLFSDAAGTAPILAVGNPILAIDVDQLAGSESPASGNENVNRLIDGASNTKYLNFGRRNAGFIVTPTLGPKSIVTSFVMTTANDAADRDPASYALYGTNAPITSANHSTGSAEAWTLISSGPLSLPTTRGTLASPVTFANATAYSSYRMVFPELRNAPVVDSFQLAEVQFDGVAVPEPATWLLALAGATGLGLIRYRRK